MNRRAFILRAPMIRAAVILAAILCAGTVRAQYYDWGPSPASVKWKKLETPDVKLIYPTDFEENARRVMWYLDTVRTHIGFGYRRGTMRSPVVIHTRNTMGNGMVMWAPKRIELLAAPGASYSEPWLKQLAIHEYRHNVQYNNLRRGVNRPLMWLLGEQAGFLGVGQFSIYILEGDATMAETELSAFGRGLQPSWTMHYRAMGDGDGSRGRGEVGSRKYAGDYWFSGSLRDYVPDHYKLGYQLVRWSHNNFGRFIWDDMARYVSRNPYLINPLVVGLRHKFGMNQTTLFRRTFADLNAWWDSLPRVENTSERIETPETSYTTYQWPVWLDDNTLVAFKTDLDRTSRIVRVDAQAGSEEVLAYTGSVSSRPVLSAQSGKLWWTEYRQSTLWSEKVNSRLCSYDLATGRKQVHEGAGSHDPAGEQILYPAPLPDGSLAYVAYDYSGRHSIIKGTGERIDFPLDVEITGLAWDDATGKLYFIGLDDGGMFLGAVPTAPNGSDDGTGYRRLTPSRHITVSDLRAGGGRLYFGSIVSGKDEAHCYDLATGTEYRLTGSAYGSFQPSPSKDGGRIALAVYDRHGYHLAVQDAAAVAVEQEQRALPVDLVNPPWKRWELPKMDSLVYTPAAAERSKTTHARPKKYRKALHLFRPHSWLPLGFYPPAAIQEQDLTMHLGATVMSQNLLSDAVSWLSYGWGGSVKGGGTNGGSMLRGGFSYSGLGVVADVDFTWGGGTQTLYTAIPQELNLRLKKYFSITTRLSLPMTLSSGHWYGTFTPSAEYFYTNGLIFRQYNGEMGRSIRGELTRGVERLTFGAAYSGQARMAYKEFLPRWGVSVRTQFVANPTNRDFRNIWSVSLGGWLPGVVRPHSTKLRLAWQQSVGRDGASYMFRMKEVFPRGAEYDFSARRWASASLDYQLPVWYPEWGWTSIIYFKRVRLNVFSDYARWQDFAGRWHPLFSYGGDIILDVSPLRLPASTHVTVKLTLAKPGDRRGVFAGFGLEFPL